MCERKYVSFEKERERMKFVDTKRKEKGITDRLESKFCLSLMKKEQRLKPK